jgi:hypothetical protein
MSKFTPVKVAIASLTLITAAVRAQAPQMLPYTASLPTNGPTAIATTSGTLRNQRSAYVVAATGDAKGKLQVTAWQDTTKARVQMSQADLGGNKVMALAATGLDPTHVVTADIDDEGTLYLKTWTIGGTAGVTLLNKESVLNAGELLYTLPPNLAVNALSSTEVVTAYQDANGNLNVAAWTVSDTSAAPVPLGADWHGGPVNQVSMAVIDSATVITATSIPFTNTLAITTFGVDSKGVHLQDTMSLKNVVDGGLYPSVAIGASSVLTPYSIGGGLTGFKIVRSAFTPLVTADQTAEVIYWNISDTGAISEVPHPPGNSSDYLYATAACSLPAGVPISIYTDEQVGWTNEVHVAWYGKSGREAEYPAISGMGTGVSALAAASAGSDFNVLDPYVEYEAYFVTGAVTQTTTQEAENKGNLQLRLWSYPIEPLLL